MADDTGPCQPDSDFFYGANITGPDHASLLSLNSPLQVVAGTSYGAIAFGKNIKTTGPKQQMSLQQWTPPGGDDMVIPDFMWVNANATHADIAATLSAAHLVGTCTLCINMVFEFGYAIVEKFNASGSPTVIPASYALTADALLYGIMNMTTGEILANQGAGTPLSIYTVDFSVLAAGEEIRPGFGLIFGSSNPTFTQGSVSLDYSATANGIQGYQVIVDSSAPNGAVDFDWYEIAASGHYKGYAPAIGDLVMFYNSLNNLNIVRNPDDLSLYATISQMNTAIAAGVASANTNTKSVLLYAGVTLGLVGGVLNDDGGSHSDGALYMVGSSPTGAFAGFTPGDIAEYNSAGSGSWSSFHPRIRQQISFYNDYNFHGGSTITLIYMGQLNDPYFNRGNKSLNFLSIDDQVFDNGWMVSPADPLLQNIGAYQYSNLGSIAGGSQQEVIVPLTEGKLVYVDASVADDSSDIIMALHFAQSSTGDIDDNNEAFSGLTSGRVFMNIKSTINPCTNNIKIRADFNDASILVKYKGNILSGSGVFIESIPVDKTPGDSDGLPINDITFDWKAVRYGSATSGLTVIELTRGELPAIANGLSGEIDSYLPVVFGIADSPEDFYSNLWPKLGCAIIGSAPTGSFTGLLSGSIVRYQPDGSFLPVQHWGPGSEYTRKAIFVTELFNNIPWLNNDEMTVLDIYYTTGSVKAETFVDQHPSMAPFLALGWHACQRNDPGSVQYGERVTVTFSDGNGNSYSGFGDRSNYVFNSQGNSSHTCTINNVQGPLTQGFTTADARPINVSIINSDNTPLLVNASNSTTNGGLVPLNSFYVTAAGVNPGTAFFLVTIKDGSYIWERIDEDRALSGFMDYPAATWPRQIDNTGGLVNVPVVNDGRKVDYFELLGTLGANIQLPTQAANGMSYPMTLMIKTNAGGVAVTWDASYKHSNGAAPDLTGAAAGAVHLFQITPDGLGNYYVISTLNF